MSSLKFLPTGRFRWWFVRVSGIISSYVTFSYSLYPVLWEWFHLNTFSFVSDFLWYLDDLEWIIISVNIDESRSSFCTVLIRVL